MLCYSPVARKLDAKRRFFANMLIAKTFWNWLEQKEEGLERKQRSLLFHTCKWLARRRKYNTTEKYLKANASGIIVVKLPSKIMKRCLKIHKIQMVFVERKY